MPDWTQEIQRFLAGLSLEPTQELEIAEEVAQHLSDRYDELVVAGTTPEQAYRAVVGELNRGQFAAALRPILRGAAPPITPGAENGGGLFASLAKDLRFGARLLRLNPGFALIAILSLALGIGANTAIFQLLDAVRLRTLPVKNPQELADVRIVDNPHGRTGRFAGRNPQLTFALWQQIRAHQQAFSGITAWNSTRLNLSQGGEARYADVLYLSGSFFDVLGVRPALGRLFSPADDQHGCSAAGAVISYAFWQRQFGGNPSVLKTNVSVERHAFPIVGVTSRDFFGVEVGRNFDVALPLCAEPIIASEEPITDNPAGWWLHAIGRLKPGWTLQRASAQLA